MNWQNKQALSELKDLKSELKWLRLQNTKDLSEWKDKLISFISRRYGENKLYLELKDINIENISGGQGEKAIEDIDVFVKLNLFFDRLKKYVQENPVQSKLF